MMAQRKGSHAEELLSSLRDRAEAERFVWARGFLQQHCVCMREVLNGKDFLFSGPAEELRNALKEIVRIEQQCSRFLLFDYTQIDEYFLLRIRGGEEHQESIRSYFE